MSDLRSELQEIQGVGEATADAILDVLDAHDPDAEVPDEALAALDYLEADRPGYAEKYLRRLVEGA